MFNNSYFYHQHVRKAIVSFGTLFNNIRIRRTNSTDEAAQSLVVPLSYAPKQKFIDRIREVPDLETGRATFAITLPRIGFEITNFSYDASRKLAITQNVRAVDTSGTSNTNVRYSFISTPYNMGIGLSVFAKNQDDGLQIIEQILPYFNPDFNVTINEIPALGVKRDLQIILDGIEYQDEWEGSFENRLSVMWNLNFTIKMNFFGYVQDANLIKKTIQNIYTDYGLFEGGAPTNNQVGKRITTSITPENATPLDNYQFVQEFDDIFASE
jgi:hypothetical protein